MYHHKSTKKYSEFKTFPTINKKRSILLAQNKCNQLHDSRGIPKKEIF